MNESTSCAHPRQLSLFERTLAARFELWLHDNPVVWDLFVRFALDLIRAGHKRYSADAVVHRIRWHVDVETRSNDGFKINNNHVAYLARRFEQVYPTHVGFFRMRGRGA